MSAFSPFIFEGKHITESSLNHDSKLRISKLSSTVNGIFIGIVPAIALIATEYLRGIPQINLTGNQKFDVYANSSLNLLFSSSKANVISCILFILLSLLAMLYIFGDKEKCIIKMKRKKARSTECEIIENEEIELHEKMFPKMCRSKSVYTTSASRIILNKRRKSYP